MIWVIATLLLIPLGALLWNGTRAEPREPWRAFLTKVAILFAVGLFCAGPFMTTRSLGTSEAYNYSLAVADAVTQFREGIVPALVGQSEFAFNGRIHPLRTAPYLTYFAGLLDLVTFRQLNFWALQNLALAFSLIAAPFTTYFSIRRSTGAPSSTALALAASWMLAPGVLAAAYSMDLYMTVMAVPFIPCVVGANVAAALGRRTLRTYLCLGVFLGLCWWAHPPVAFWLSLGTLFVHLALLLSLKLRVRELGSVIAAAAVGLAVAAFVFVSALTIRGYDSMSAARAPEAVVKEVVQAFSASISPISANANQLGDFQLGYLFWLLLCLSVLSAIVRRRWDALVLGAVTTLLLAFTVPIPGVTAWLWDKMPTFAITVNGPWPMQRLYLVAGCWIAFVASIPGLLPITGKVPKAVRDIGVLMIAGLALWTAYQGFRFVGRGYSSRMDASYTRTSHREENLNPTLIAYAMLPLPPWFEHGVMDPRMETRILARGTAAPIAENWTAADAIGPEVAKGTFAARSGEGDIAVLSPRLTLEPGKRYRLELQFRSPPIDGVIRFTGPNTLRVYPLPQAGEPRGFGMLPGNRRVLTLWTSAAEPEIVTVELIGSGLGSARLLNFADFTLRTFDPEKLPVKVDTLVPFRARVSSPVAGYVEIPRVFLDGYNARVNGQSVRAQKSPDGQVMAAIPAGESQVEITHPGSPLVRASFWTSVAALASVVLGTLLFHLRPQLAAGFATRASRVVHFLRARALLALVLVLTPVAAFAGWNGWTRYADAAGPLRLKLVLPRGEVGRSQPLLTTGEPQKGTFIFVIYTDPAHVQIGIDVWGQGYAWTSPPIPVDYFAEHEVVISSGALYPLSHPKVNAADPAVVKRLRERITVDLNGNRVLDQTVFSFDSERDDVTIGENRIQGSSTEPTFVGKILECDRLPIPNNP